MRRIWNGWLAWRICALLVFASATVLPFRAWGQSAVWLPVGATSGNIYYNGGNVGIGTSSPGNKLTVSGGAISIDEGQYVLSNSGNHLLTSVYGNLWLGLEQGIVLRSGYYNTMYLSTSGMVGIGTTNPQYLLAVEGTIGAKEVIVTNLGWSDYVFRPDYRLRPLNEVAEYIQAHHHLPDVPSEEEVKEKGVSVGEMQSKLLAKIEELTLHMIEQERENRRLRDRIAKLESRAAGAGANESNR